MTKQVLSNPIMEAEWFKAEEVARLKKQHGSMQEWDAISMGKPEEIKSKAMLIKRMNEYYDGFMHSPSDKEKHLAKIALAKIAFDETSFVRYHVFELYGAAIIFYDAQKRSTLVIDL